MKKRQVTLIIIISIFLVNFLIGCSSQKDIVKESTIKEDLQNYNEVINHLELEISSIEIDKRLTKVENNTDTIWVIFEAENDILSYRSECEVKYTLYNDGWEYESYYSNNEIVIPYYDFEGIWDYQTTPNTNLASSSSIEILEIDWENKTASITYDGCEQEASIEYDLLGEWSHSPKMSIALQFNKKAISLYPYGNYEEYGEYFYMYDSVGIPLIQVDSTVMDESTVANEETINDDLKRVQFLLYDPQNEDPEAPMAIIKISADNVTLQKKEREAVLQLSDNIVQQLKQYEGWDGSIIANDIEFFSFTVPIETNTITITENDICFPEAYENYDDPFGVAYTEFISYSPFN